MMMVGYAVLSDKPTELILSKHLLEENAAVQTLDFFEYVIEKIDEDRQLLVILTPIQGSFTDTISHFREQLGDLSQYHILAGVVGHGATERHIISVYVPPKGDIHCFDSKANLPEKFFSKQMQDQGFSWRWLFSALWNALRPRPESSFTLDDGQEQRRVVYSALGTQSFFDGVSCGYHHAAQLLGLRKLLQKKRPLLVDDLLEELHDPVRQSGAALKETAYEARAYSDFSGFMKKAWLDTYLAGKNEDERESLHFGHYFMGWSTKKGTARQVVYFLTLGFIFNPLINVLKLPELLANGLSETASFLKNSLIAWAPTHPATQYVRSGLLLTTIGLQGLFKGLYFLVRTVTSPIVSFEEAWRVHWTLGILSAVISLAAYGALAYFAAPALVPLIMSASPAVVPILNALAYPLVKLFALMGVSLTTGTAAAGLVTFGAAILQTGKLLLNKLVDAVEDQLAKKTEKEVVAQKSEESNIPPTSNAQEALSKIAKNPLPDNTESAKSIQESTSVDNKSRIKKLFASEKPMVVNPEDTSSEEGFTFV